jgi:hypothetical protein
MSERQGSAGHALLIYAALGVAIGLVAWALLVHDGSGSETAGQPQQTIHTGEPK